MLFLYLSFLTDRPTNEQTNRQVTNQQMDMRVHRNKVKKAYRIWNGRGRKEEVGCRNALYLEVLTLIQKEAR